MSPALAGGFFTTEHQGSPNTYFLVPIIQQSLQGFHELDVPTVSAGAGIRMVLHGGNGSWGLELAVCSKAADYKQVP